MTQIKISSKIAQYSLLEEIGSGAHGVVYKAYHQQRPSETVALKIILDIGNLDALLIEPQLLSRLKHPHIIPLKDYFLDHGNLIIVTEYIEGENLQSYLKKRGRLTAEEVLIFLIQMYDALVHAHNNNIIHRDIKPSNILVKGSGQNIQFILIDFGVSRIAQGIQMVKRSAGTYEYMAPEQLTRKCSKESDLLALGACAYNLLTGLKPFQGNANEDLFKKILLRIPKSPNLIREKKELIKLLGIIKPFSKPL